MNKDLAEFKDRLVTDDEFYKKVKECGSTAEVIRFAAEAGYVFTEKELEEETELSDAELASAAGGTGIAGSIAIYAGIVGK